MERGEKDWQEAARVEKWNRRLIGRMEENQLRRGGRKSQVQKRDRDIEYCSSNPSYLRHQIIFCLEKNRRERKEGMCAIRFRQSVNNRCAIWFHSIFILIKKKQFSAIKNLLFLLNICVFTVYLMLILFLFYFSNYDKPEKC